MNTVSLQLSDASVAIFGTGDGAAESILTAAVVKWYELGRVSHGKAAEILGVSRSEFLELLAGYKVSAWQYTEAEIERELALV